MTKTISTLALVVALFSGAVMADDGNMGGGNYTQCGGTNPPPTCPPSNGGGYANMGSTSDTSVSDGIDAVGLTLVLTDTIVETMNLIY